MDTLIAVPELALRNGTEAVATLSCGHRILIDGEFSVDDRGHLFWDLDARGPTTVLFACPMSCPPDAQRIEHIWRFSDN